MYFFWSWSAIANFVDEKQLQRPGNQVGTTINEPEFIQRQFPFVAYWPSNFISVKQISNRIIILYLR